MARQDFNLAKPLPHTRAEDRQAAVAILAGLTAKQKGGGRLAQDLAARKAVRMLNDGFTAATSIDVSARVAVRQIQNHAVLTFREF